MKYNGAAVAQMTRIDDMEKRAIAVGEMSVRLAKLAAERKATAERSEAERVAGTRASG